MDQFVHEGSPLFGEFLGLLETLDVAADVRPIGPGDALLVIDMQCDFLPKDDVSNPHGGRFGVAEGDHIVRPIAKLIDHFAARGGSVAATRDYHPHDHVSFLSQGGPFPAHCVQGTKGSEFVPPISRAMAAAMRQRGPEAVAVAFKAMHEDVDSFGGLEYYHGGAGRISQRGGLPERAMPCTMGCAAAPWTGSLVLKLSGLAFALADPDTAVAEPEVNAPPDVFAALDDGKDRQLTSLSDFLRPARRLFVCGLALDFCVLDTCLNGVALGFPSVTMLLDAARAAHIPGVGGFGTGFLSEPAEVKRKLREAGVQLASYKDLIGAPAPLEKSLSIRSALRATITAAKEQADAAKADAFPHKLGPISLVHAPLEISLSRSPPASRKQPSGSHPDAAAAARTYTARLKGGVPLSTRVPGCADGGNCSPTAPIPPGWPDCPPSATHLCWAYPIDGVAALQASAQLAFLAVSASPEFHFALYGGFLLLDAEGSVVAVKAVQVGGSSALLEFEGPRKWRPEFLPPLRAAGRLQPVTLPPLLAAGAEAFCWINPHETLTSGPESWSPSGRGAFVYAMRGGEDAAIYFPVTPKGGGGGGGGKKGKGVGAGGSPLGPPGRTPVSPRVARASSGEAATPPVSKTPISAAPAAATTPKEPADVYAASSASQRRRGPGSCATSSALGEQAKPKWVNPLNVDKAFAVASGYRIDPPPLTER